MSIKIKELKELQPFLNISKIAENSGLNHKSVHTKLNRLSELTVVESESISDELKKLADNIKKVV